MRSTRAGFFVILTFIFISCRSLSPVDGQAERLIFAESPERVVPQWQPFAEYAVDGIGYCTGKVSRPRIAFYALRIDLSVPELRIFTAGGAASVAGESGDPARPFLSTRVSTFVREHNLLAGINALPFDPVSATEREPRANIGVVISEGVMVSPPHRHYDALVFYADGSAGITAQSAIDSAEGISNAVGGFQRILAAGELVPRVIDTTARHPRSAAGLSPDSRFLYLLVIDGRQLRSIGSTEAETALLLRSLGATEGINFDGGGSSSLALRYPDGEIRVVNTPIHRQVPGWERAVAGCLGLWAEVGE